MKTLRVVLWLSTVLLMLVGATVALASTDDSAFSSVAGHVQEAQLTASSCGIDMDQDGLDDALEQRLIDYYRPYYRFDSRQHNSDDKWPASVSWFIGHCSLKYYLNASEGSGSTTVFTSAQLSANPELVLAGGSASRPSSDRSAPGADAKSRRRQVAPVR